MNLITRTPLLAGLFAVSVFVSAFLLFQIQPMISKAILPWFGGTPSVWTTCLLFFQAVLFGGYLYAHLVTTKLSPKWQAGVHSSLLLAACLTLTIVPHEAWKPTGREQPILRILAVLLATVGLPYFVLSTTGPLLQAWFGRVFAGSSPYRLYALSNAGSLLALISYPFVFEPAIGLSRQAVFWTSGFVGLAILCGICSWLPAFFRTSSTELDSQQPPDESKPIAQDGRQRVGGKWWHWMSLSMMASVMLLATTNQVCQDVAVVPFLWVVPLSLYLLTFILCFDGERWYSRMGFGLAGAISVGGVLFIMQDPTEYHLTTQIAVYFAALFTTAMVCHGELARLKPEPERLTAFYLTLAAGGAAGGILVAVVAPLVFPLFLEFHLGLLICVLLSLGVYWHEAKQNGRVPLLHKLVVVGTGAGLIAAGYVVVSNAEDVLGASFRVERNFYGVIRLRESHSGDPSEHTKTLVHGRISHGFQYQSPEKAMWPTSYYGPDSGVGRTFQILKERHPELKVGIVGLGTGTLSAYGREDDFFCYYEINEAIVRMAREEFSFLKKSPAENEIVLGDARLQMEQRPPQGYDLLILDAFSGDSIPTHLLSKEAMKIYTRHLAPDGVLAIHISNIHFDLAPVVLALADQAGFDAKLTSGNSDEETGQSANYWFIGSPDSSIVNHELLNELKWKRPDERILWTDDFSNLFSVLK